MRHFTAIFIAGFFTSQAALCNPPDTQTEHKIESVSSRTASLEATENMSAEQCSNTPKIAPQLTTLVSEFNAIASTSHQMKNKKIKGFPRVLQSTLPTSVKRKLIENLATKSKEDVTFYRWGSVEEYNKVGKPLNVVNHGGHESAGLGLYVSETPTGSVEYGIKNEVDGRYGFVVVKVKKGTRTLDLTDPNIQDKLNARGLTNQDVFAMNKNIIVKYTEPYNDTLKTFWILKDLKSTSIHHPTAEHLKNHDHKKLFANLPTKAHEEFMRNHILKENSY